MSWLEWAGGGEGEGAGAGPGPTGAAAGAGAGLFDFTRRLMALRRDHAVFRRTTFLDGHGREERLPDAWWFRPDGHAMRPDDWHDLAVRAVGLFLHGEQTRVVTALGEPELDDSFLLIVNPHAEAVRFELPKSHLGRQWAVELSTAEPEGELHAVAAAGTLSLEGRSLVVLRRIG